MKKLLLKLLIVCGLLFSTLGTTTLVSATECPRGTARAGQDIPLAECNIPEDKPNEGLMSRVQVIINVVIGVLGVVAVAMIIVGGIMYTTSQGQPEKVKRAKDIILYSVIGLIVALLAFAIVNFVLTNVFK